MSDKKLEENMKDAERLADIQREYYPEFQREEGIPVYTGFHFDDLKTIEVKPWARMGGLGAFVNLLGEETLGGNYLCEIPPGETLKPQRHMYEELVYVVSGRGRQPTGPRKAVPGEPSNGKSSPSLPSRPTWATSTSTAMKPGRPEFLPRQPCRPYCSISKARSSSLKTTLSLRTWGVIFIHPRRKYTGKPPLGLPGLGGQLHSRRPGL